MEPVEPPGMAKLQAQLKVQVGDSIVGKVVAVPCSFLLHHPGVKHVHWSESHGQKYH